MACRYREELVGKRFISVRSAQKLKIQKISEWEWRSGVVRALSSRDTSSLDLSVLIEFDDIDWTRREWVRIHDIFQLFLVEHTLVWAERPDPDKPRQSISWPGLSFRAVVDKVGLSACKRKPVEFLVDKFLGLVEEKEIQIFQEGEENAHPTALLRKEVQLSLKAWLDYQDGQKILLTTPTVLVGYRLEVYRAEGTTQWYTAVIQSYNHTSKTLSVTDDTVLEEHNEDPTLIQMHLIDDGVVDSILRGVEIGGIAPRRRPRAVKQEKEPTNSTTKPSSTAANQTPPVSRSALSRKSRTPQSTTTTTTTTSAAAVPVPAPSVVSVVGQETTDKQDSKGTDRTVRQRQQNSKDRKRKVEPEVANEDTKSNSPSVNSKKRITRCEESNSKPQGTQNPQISTKTESSPSRVEPSRVSPRITPSKEKVKPQRTREIDKDRESSVENDIKDTVKVNGPVTIDSEGAQSKTKVRSRQKKEVNSPSQRTESPKSRTEFPRTRNSNPESSRTSQIQEAEAVIKSNCNSGIKKDRKSDRRVSKSAKSDTSNSDTKTYLGLSKLNTSEKSSNKNTASATNNTSSDTSSSNKGKCDSDLVEQKLQEIKSAFESRKEKDGERVTKSKESKSEACVEKQTRRKDRKKNLECTQVELGKCAKKVNEEETLKESCERDTIGESGDNMHYRKKKQSLLSGGVPSGLPQNSGISSSCIDFNQSVTDQIARAEKLSNLGSEEKSGSVSSTLSSPVSEPYTDRNEQEFPSHPREGNKHIPNSLSSSHNTNTNSSWSQDERSQSCNSEDRCSSGFSDDLRRPGSRVDELKSSKTSPASSPLIVDKSEPVQIYRDPELMSKNPVRSNVPNMHNSHKSYPSVHNPIPTQASRPSSVGMSSTPLSSGLERTRTPVIPSVAYPSPLPLGASLPGASLSCLLPPGLHQLDPATLAMHQQVAALQQQHLATALASQYSNALSMSSYPPRGSLNSAQLEHLWQQKYPSVPVPPPWLLAKHQDDLIRDVRILHEQEQLERERMDRMERERELREREQRERKECERRDRERQEKERQERERREREKIEQERVERERLEREKLEKERLERERRERERLERERVERNRILKESVDSHAAVDQHFSESLRLASQRNWKRPPNHPNQIQEGYHVHSNANHHPKYTAAQTGMWPTPSITLGTGKPKTEPQSLPNSYKGGEKSGEIKPEEKIKQEQLREADYRFAEIMRKHQELMSQQEEYIKQRIYQKHLAAGEHNVKSEVKSEQAKDVKPVIYPGYPGKTEQLVNSSPSSVKREDGTASFSLYGYQPEKYSYITTDQLHSYELDKIKSEKANMDSKLVGRPQSPRKKDISVPPPLIKDSKPHSSVIVENKLKEGSMKSSSPHPAHQQYTSRMSPHHHPKPAHTPDRNHERPSPNSSSPGSSHGMSPSLAHSQHMAALNARQVTSRSQSPLRIASPQQLSVAVMQPMDYRCSPATNKSRGSPGSSGSPHLSVSSNVNSSGVYTPAIAQAPVSLPQSSVAFSYSLIQQGLVPNPIYTNNSQGKNSDSQRTVSVTGTAQVPRAASSPQGCGNNQQQQQQQQQQSAITQGTKRKGPKEGNNRKRQKGGESQVHTSPGSNNPLNLSIPVTTPQILTNQSPYTTCSVTASTSSAGSVATTSTTQSGGPLPTINNRLSGFSGFMDSFKSFVENTVQNAFMSDPELGKQKDGQMKRPTPEQLKQLQQQHQLQQQQQAALQGQTGKPKSSLERSSTPVTSQQSSSSSAIRNTNEDSNSNLGNSGNSTNSALLESINRVANGQVDTDSDTLSAPSPPPHLKQENNTASPHKSAKHPNLKKAWLQRHSDEDKQEVKPAVSALSQQPMPVKMETETSNSNDMFGELSGELDKDDKDKDKEQVKNCYVNCSYISPSKEGGSKSPISAIQTVLPNGTVEKNGIDESTTSASETEIQPADNSRKRVKTKKERNTNTKKPKTEVQELSASPISTSPTNTNNPDPVTSTPGSTNTTTVDQNSSTASSSNSNTSNSSQNNQTNKKKNSRRNKDSKPKNSPDTMSEEQIKKIVENCKDSVKEKEKDTKPTEEAYDKMFDTDESSSLSKNDPSESEANKSDQERMENEINRKAERKDKKKNKDKKDKKNRKEKQKEKEKQYEDEDEVEMKEVIHAAPPPILKETEIKISQQTSFAKPLVRVPVSVLRKTCEPFLQDGSCSEVTPKLMKCRECKMTPTQRGKTVPNIFCRFYAFRRLKYSQRGFVTIDGFSELTDAEQDDIDPWIPKSPINEPRFDVETAKFIIRRVGDKFCELVQQERDAQFCAGENAKVAWKRAVTGVREMCDVCDTTLFNMHWVCHKCGFVVCLDCYTVKARELRDEETENTDCSDDESSEEQRKWLTCSANRQPHDVDKLMLTQIIPADALWEVGRLIHEVRDKWTLQSSCKCNNKHPVKKNGIKTDLMHEAIKHLSPKKKMVNGIGGEHKPRTKNGNIKTAVYHPDSTSPLSLLADVASMDSEKTRDRSESPFSKKKESKQGKSYTPITEPVSPGSGEKKMPPSCSTLRELLTKTAGAKAKNNSDSNNKKKTKNTSSLDDIIQKVVEKQIPKEMSPTNLLSNETVNEPMKLLHYTPRFGKCHKLTRETPILIHNLTETSVLYPDVPHSWLCDGRLLRLHDPLHKGNLKIFMEQWRRGQPVLVSGADKYMNQHLWKPEFFSKQFGELENDLVNCRTGCLVVGQPMKHFWDGFNCMEERLVDEEGTPMLLKLKDWPPSDDFSDLLPQQFNDLMQALPLPEYTRRDGRLNVVSRLPDFLVKPDLGPKMYIAYGSAQFPKEGTTNLHLDVSDATNVMVYVGYLDDEQKGHMQKDAEAIKAMEMARCDSITKRRIKEVHESPGALWHIFDAVDADKIRDFLNKVGKERGEKVEQDHDPIHDQSWYLDELLRDRLAKEYGVLGYTIIQCLGDAIFIPAGAPHQVRNLNNCIKVAEDFVSAENIHHCFNLTEEFRHLSDGHSNHEDKLQVKNIVYHAVKDAVAVLKDAEREDCDDGF